MWVKWHIRVLLVSGFCVMKQLGIILFPLDEMLVHRRVISIVKFTQRYKLRPFWLLWQVEKNCGNQNSGESRQLVTNRLKRNLLEKLSIQ